MPIEFHCDHCGKMVKTSNENAGKRGRCPHCKNSVYIPTPTEDIETIPLVPIDEEAEREKQRLAEETRELTRRLRSERSEIPESAGESYPQPVGGLNVKPDMETLIIDYVLAMADGNLQEAEEYAAEIRADMDKADEIIDRLTVDDLPPRQLNKVPRPVMIGLLKQLRS